ncbi:MAG TPA: MFS transporter [Actinomycetota bacterium]|nr:MFS transporter [Actinomycetota bacterium]
MAALQPGTTRIDLVVVRRRTTTLLSGAQVLGGLAVAGSLPAGALIGASLGGTAAAGLAQTAGVLGAALLALPLARIALTRGRRVSLATGYGLGALGAGAVVVAGVTRSLPMLMLGCLLLGAANAAGYQARYAATDLAEPRHRGRALAIVVWAGTVGAVLGPNLLQFSGRLAVNAGLPQLTGPFVLATAVLTLAAALLLMLLRPDPYLLSLARTVGKDSPRPRLRDGLAHLRGHRLGQLGIVAVSVGHLAMIMVMVMTPVHMAHVDVSLQLIGLVISVHVLGMFALSPVVGWGVDRYGRQPVIAGGAVVLLLACAVSAMAPADDAVTLGAGLFLLGLGWSCTLIAGSTLLTDDADEAQRPAIQGLSDLTMNVAGAAGGILAGVIVVWLSYAALCAAAAVPVLGLLVLLAASRRTA